MLAQRNENTNFPVGYHTFVVIVIVSKLWLLVIFIFRHFIPHVNIHDVLLNVEQHFFFYYYYFIRPYSTLTDEIAIVI